MRTIDVKTRGIDTQSVDTTWSKNSTVTGVTDSQEIAQDDVVAAFSHTATCIASNENVVVAGGVATASTQSHKEVVDTGSACA